MSKKEVVVQETTEVMTAEMAAEWGMDEVEVSSNDLVIPKLHLMQALSEMVAEKELAKAGDIVDAIDETVVGDSKKAVELVPFKVEKLWYVIKENGDRGELDSIYPVTKENEGQEREFEIEGEKYKRLFVYKYFFVREGSSLPYIVTFKSTSLRAGKQLFTEMFIKNRMAGKSPAARTVLLSSEKQKNDKGVYYIWKVSMGKDASAELQAEALNWFKTLKVKDYKEASDDAPTAAQSEPNY